MLGPETQFLPNAANLYGFGSGLGYKVNLASGATNSINVGYFAFTDLAVDGNGNLWVTVNFDENGSLIDLSNSGAQISPPYDPPSPVGPGFGCGYCKNASSVAVDGSGNVWVSSNNATTGYGFLAEVIGIASPVVTPIVAGVKNNMLGTRP